ncbi:MAG: lysophospholipid acyltransferase family protein [Myxococcota bacterium]
MYNLLAFIFGLALDLFYRRRHAGGRVPNTGPVLLVANHPNALMDPLVLLRVAGRRVRFLAKAPLFEMPVLGWLVKGLDALPVFRAKDGADTARNDQTFVAVHQALQEGACICLFPEGISHDEPQLQPLKTGAARMALGAEAQADFKLGVVILPVGLTYRDKAIFRSEVASELGPPLRASDYAEAFRTDERAAVQQLTNDIDAGIRTVTLNLETWEDLPLIEVASALSHGQSPRDARVRAFADGVSLLRHHAPERLERTRARVAEFTSWLRDAGITVQHLDDEYSVGSVLGFVLRNLVALLLGTPVALLGAAAYAVPFYAVDLLTTVLRRKPDETATVKILASLLFFPLWHVAMVCVLTATLGWELALPLGVALPFCGLYTRHYFRRRGKALRDAAVFLAVGRGGALKRAMRAERDALAAEIDALAEEVERLRAATPEVRDVVAP